MFVLNFPDFDALQWTLLGLLLGGVAAVFSLAACWVPLGQQGRWYQRAVLWLLLVVLLEVAEVRDLSVVVIAQGMALALAWLIFRAVREKWRGGPPLRFSLGDLAAGLVVAAILLAMLTRIEGRREWWLNHLRVGAALAVWTLTATMTLWSARLRAAPLLQLVVGFAGAAVGAALFAPYALGFSRYPPRDWLYDGFWLQRGLFSLAFVALLSLQARLLFYRVALPKRPPPESLLAGALGLAASGLAFALFVAVVFYDPGMPQQPMPTPNGYDELLAMGAEVLKAGPANSATWSAAEQDEYLARTARARREIQRVLQLPAVAHLDRDIAHGGFEFRALARAMRVEGQLHAARGDHDAAFRAYMANVEFSERISHGGLWIHLIVGDPIRGEQGIDCMRRLPDWPGGERFQELRHRLESMLSSAEPMETVYQRDRQFQQHVYRGLSRVYTFLDEFNPYTARRLDREQDQRRRTQIAVLIAELALARHVEVKASAPRNLADLVPEFMSEIPADAYLDAPLRYRLSSDGAYVVYSVGPNRIDDRSGGDDIAARGHAPTP